MVNRIGEKWKTNEGYEIEIIEYFSAVNCNIRFENGVILTNKEYSKIKRGEIKNPLHKSILGVGYYGIGNYTAIGSNNKITISYRTWYNMLYRCYNKSNFLKRPTYEDCTVCDDWYDYQKFAKWFNENYIEGFELDKDILFKGNKIYSPDTCCFVPSEINILFTKRNKLRGDLPIGVSKKSKCKGFIFTFHGKHLGTFPTEEEAFVKYKETKETEIKRVANIWKPEIKPNVYEALSNYKVEITD